MNALEFGPADREIFLRGAGGRAEKLTAYLAEGVFDGGAQANLCEQLLAQINEGGLPEGGRRELEELAGRGKTWGRGLWRCFRNRLDRAAAHSLDQVLERSAGLEISLPQAAGVHRLARASLALDQKWLLALTVHLTGPERVLFFETRRRLLSSVCAGRVEKPAAAAGGGD